MKNNSGAGAPVTNVRAANPKPWEDESGKPLSEEGLKFASQYWSDETWEKYLLTIEKEQTEYLCAGFDKLLYQSDLERSFTQHIANENGSEPESFTERVPDQRLQDAIHKLTLRERQAIQAIFYQGLSQAEAAKTMRLCPSRVSRLLQGALLKLKDHLTPIR